MPLSVEEIKKLDAFVDAWNEGGARAASDAVGISKKLASVVASCLRSMGVDAPKQRGSKWDTSRKEFDLSLAIQMRRSGITDSAIAKHFGVSTPLICRRLGSRKVSRPTVDQFLAMKQAAE